MLPKQQPPAASNAFASHECWCPSRLTGDEGDQRAVGEVLDIAISIREHG